MKNLYLALFVIGMMSLAHQIFIPTQNYSEDSLRALAHNPELWDIQYVEVKEPAPSLDQINLDPYRSILTKRLHDTKSFLIKFLDEKLNRSFLNRLLSNLAILIAILFSIIGYVREEYIEKAKRNGA